MKINPSMTTIPQKQRWDAIIERFHPGNVLTGVELGVWRGGLSEKLLRALPNLTLHMVDRWAAPTPGGSYAGSGASIATKPEIDHRMAMEESKRRTQFANPRNVIIRSETAEAAALFPTMSCDFVFIDADHSFAGVTADLAAWFSRVKPGGWLCGHDWDHPDQGEVKRAVLTFLAEIPGAVAEIELSYGRTWFYRKK
jgi:SAM-dependent methyltransferase